MNHAESFFAAAAQICHDISFASIEDLASELDHLRDRKGRLFLIGVGGSAANCSHAVNDFRKLCGIETYSPVDNVSELTARTNEEGWDYRLCGLARDQPPQRQGRASGLFDRRRAVPSATSA